MNKTIAIVGIVTALVFTGCDPYISYTNDSGGYAHIVDFNEDDNVRMTGFNIVESNDNITVIINLKKNSK